MGLLGGDQERDPEKDQSPVLEGHLCMLVGVLAVSNRKQAWLKQAGRFFLVKLIFLTFLENYIKVMGESIEPPISWDEGDFGA